jgi:hypothetical protein
MNHRQAKKQEKKKALEYLEYLDKYFDENEKWCILNNCPYYDYSGRYGGGCADHLAPKGFKCENPYS